MEKCLSCLVSSMFAVLKVVGCWRSRSLGRKVGAEPATIMQVIALLLPVVVSKYPLLPSTRKC